MPVPWSFKRHLPLHRQAAVLVEAAKPFSLTLFNSTVPGIPPPLETATQRQAPGTPWAWEHPRRDDRPNARELVIDNTCLIGPMLPRANRFGANPGDHGVIRRILQFYPRQVSTAPSSNARASHRGGTEETPPTLSYSDYSKMDRMQLDTTIYLQVLGSSLQSRPKK